MNWLNLEIRTLRSSRYIGSDPVERATWINLLAFCCEQENGGRIAEARLWKDRQWQQTCGVTAREVQRTSRLLEFDGDDLVVFGYPIAKEEEVRRLRSQAESAAARRWKDKGLRDVLPDGTPNGMPTAMPRGMPAGMGKGMPDGNAEGERKEKENGNSKEKENEKETPTSLPTTLPPVARAPKVDWTAGFEQFWAVYPKRVAKPDAQRAWVKQQCAPLLATIVAAVRRAAGSHDWKKEGGQFVPHPATWLNQHRWEDEVRVTGGAAQAALPMAQEKIIPVVWRPPTIPAAES